MARRTANRYPQSDLEEAGKALAVLAGGRGNVSPDDVYMVSNKRGAGNVVYVGDRLIQWYATPTAAKKFVEQVQALAIERYGQPATEAAGVLR